MTVREKIMELETSIKKASIKIANASKRRESGLDDMIAKKAKLEASLDKLVKRAEFVSDESEIPGKVDYDANANLETQDAPLDESAGADFDMTEEVPDESLEGEDEFTGMEEETEIGGEGSTVDKLEDVALTIDELISELRGETGAETEEDFTIEDEDGDEELDFSEEDEDMDFGGETEGEEEFVDESSAPSDTLPATENEKFKMASLKCKNCGGTHFIKNNGKFACQNCKALISEMLGLPMDVLELISPKLRDGDLGEESGEFGEDTYEDESIGEPIEELEESEIGGMDEFDEEPDVTIVGMEESEPIEEMGEGDFDEESEESFDEEHEESESPMEEIAEHSDEETLEDDSEEHEESESVEEEIEEHEPGGDEEEFDESENEEDEDEDQNFKESKVVYKAKLVRKANKGQTYWLVFGNETPLFKLSANYAWKDIDAAPATDEFPVKYASYYDAFTSVLYRDTIVEYCNKSGYKSCCERANGRILKSAQAFSGINNPLQQNGGSENPTPNVNTQNAPGGAPDDGTLNPDAASEDMFNGAPDNKLLVTDMIINYLAPEIANESYNLEDIMTELKATFADEAATAEFEGQLRSEADGFGDKKESEPLGGENPETGMDPLAAPMAPAGQGEGAANATEPVQPMKVAAKKVCTKCKHTPCTCKEDELEAKLADVQKQLQEKEDAAIKQAEKENVRYRVFSAKKYVEDEMQTRGYQGVPIIDTVEYLVSIGKSASEAESLVKSAVAEAVKKIVKMSESEFVTYSELLEKHPKLAAREKKESEVKFASIMENESNTPIPFMPSAELKTGIDSLFSDDMFSGSKLTELAIKNSKDRTNRRQY